MKAKYKQKTKSSKSKKTVMIKAGVVVVSLVGLFVMAFQLSKVKTQPVRAMEDRTIPVCRYYVSPSGSSSGNGSMGSPWNIQTAFNHPTSVRGGDTICLRGGRYGTGRGTKFTSILRGSSSDLPIIVRQYPGERATIDGGIIANGQHTWFWGFEITNSSTERVATESTRSTGLRMAGLGIRAINLIVHDTGHPGIAMQDQAGSYSEIYGGIIWGTGTYDTDRDGTRRGSAIYAQGDRAGTTRYIRDVISFRNLSTGMKFYGERAPMANAVFEGNVSLDNSDRQIFASGLDNPIRNLRFVNNYTYRSTTDDNEPVRMGYPNTDQIDAVFSGNYFVGGVHREGSFWIKRFQNVQMTDNVFVGVNAVVTYLPPASMGNYNWDRNSYYGGDSTPFVRGTSEYNFANWKSNTRFDTNSTYSSARKTGLDIFVRNNLYETNKANVIIYNWNRQSSVRLTANQLGSFPLRSGERYELRNAQNYYSDVLSGTYNGSEIVIPMTGRTMAPNNQLNFTPHVSFPEFGVFVLINTSYTGTPQATAAPTPRPTSRPTAAPTPRPTSAPTPTPRSRLTVYSIADTYVRSANPTTNYASATSLSVDTTPDPIEKTFLKFNMGALSGRRITKGTLRIYVTNGSVVTIPARGVNNTSWSETSITFNSRPPMTSPINRFPASGSNQWIETDVTSYVQGKEGQYVAFGIDTDNTDGLKISSRETGNSPQLILEY